MAVLLALIWPMLAVADGVVIGDAAALRWRAVGALNVGGHRTCTAVLISDHEAITAAHCVIHRETGLRTPVATFQLVLGQTATEKAAVRGIVAVAVLPGYTAKPQKPVPANLTADLALLELDAPVSPDEAVPLEVADWSKPIGDFVDIVGYERAGPDAATLREACVALDSTEGVSVVNCIVVAGVSGAPVLLSAFPDDPPKLVAIVSSRSMGAAAGLTFVVSVAPHLAALRALMANREAGQSDSTDGLPLDR